MVTTEQEFNLLMGITFVRPEQRVVCACVCVCVWGGGDVDHYKTDVVKYFVTLDRRRILRLTYTHVGV